VSSGFDGQVKGRLMVLWQPGFEEKTKMNKRFDIRIGWTKLMAALILCGSISSWSAIAQTNSAKPGEPPSVQTVPLGQSKSVYTTLAADKCKTIDVNKGMPGNYSGRCAGVGGYQLEVYLDDERNSIGVVLPSSKVIGLDLWNYFGNFSALGETAEWRMKGKKPVALIVRLNVSDQGDEKPPTSYLIVSRLNGTDACVTDIVKPGKGQNARAQSLADRALTRSCRKTDRRDFGF